MSALRLARNVARTSVRSGAFNTRCQLPVMARSFTSSRHLRSEEAAAAVEKAPVEVTSQKVQGVLDEIMTLNIMETIELVNVLKDRFGYVEQAVVAAAPSGGGAAAEAVEEEKPAEKTEFVVRLAKFDASSKIKIIKEVRTITGLGLKQAKELVEAAPDAIIKKDCPKEEAEKIQELIKKVGGDILLE